MCLIIMSFHDEDLSTDKIRCIRSMLITAESIEMFDVKIDGDFYENILKFCTSLKHFRIDSLPETQWLFQRYI